MVVLGVVGLYFALRYIGTSAIPYLTAMLIFPLPYYLTHTLVRYRFPIEPVLSILCAYGLMYLLGREKSASAGLPTED